MFISSGGSRGSASVVKSVRFDHSRKFFLQNLALHKFFFHKMFYKIPLFVRSYFQFVKMYPKIFLNFLYHCIVFVLLHKEIINLKSVSAFWKSNVQMFRNVLPKIRIELYYHSLVSFECLKIPEIFPIVHFLLLKLELPFSSNYP